MDNKAWIELGALVFSIFASTLSATAYILAKINRNKGELDQELTAIRLAAFAEYKILLDRIAEASDRAFEQFGETILSIREKVNQVELWFRDELSRNRHTLQGGMDQRHQIAVEKIEGVEERLRKVEIRLGPEN